jgi:hypothetical protein
MGMFMKDYGKQESDMEREKCFTSMETFMRESGMKTGETEKVL